MSMLVYINNLLRRRANYKKCFDSDAGKMVLADIYKFCGIYNQIHVANDPHSTSFNAGKHRVGQHIAQILNMSDDEIRKLCKQEGK